MTKRKNPFPGVNMRPEIDRHGKARWRYRRKGASIRINAPYGSKQFIEEYEAALSGTRADRRAVAPASAPGSFDWLIRSYRETPKYRDSAEITKKTRNHELEWMRERIGHMPFARFEVKHVEALMAKKDGPAAANKIRKRLSALFIYAMRLGTATMNPARLAEKRTESTTGYYTWTDADIARFRDHWPTGSKPRLALELCLNTGAARQDLARLGWQSVKAGKIGYTRGKTDVPTNLTILPELSAELAFVPTDQMLFLTHHGGQAYTPGGITNWFKKCATDAGIVADSANIHGLRKAAATRLAQAGATENEIAAILAHKGTRQAATYTREANRDLMADTGMSRLTGTEKVSILSNHHKRLDKNNSKTLKRKGN